MKNCRWFICLMCFLILTSFDELNIKNLPDHLPCSTHDIWNYHQKKVSVRGFWHSIPDSDCALLCSMPLLKSCCMVKPTTIFQQIELKNHFPKFRNGQAVTLEGFFVIDPQFNEKNEVVQLYLLKPLL